MRTSLLLLARREWPVWPNRDGRDRQKTTHYGRRTKPYLAVRFQGATVIHSRFVASGQLWLRMATHCISDAAIQARPIQMAYRMANAKVCKITRDQTRRQHSDSFCY
ncbi:hypothetical protein CUJ88_12545 [Paraburkholderia hospita]|nr:hypothetical protein CUJ88_12545 [Paraburkholderia hospita]